MYPNHIQLPVIYHIDYIQPHVICTQSHTITRDLSHWLHSTTRYMYQITYNYPWSTTLITFNHTLYVSNHIQFSVMYHIDYIQLHVICTPITYNCPWSITLITFNHTLYVPNHIQLPVIYHIDYIQPHVICTQSHTISRDLSHWSHSTTRYMYPNHTQLPVIYHIDYIQPHVICTQSHTITRDLSHWLHSTTRYMYPITSNYPWSMTYISFNDTLHVPNHIQLPVIYHIDYIQLHVICTQSHTITRDLWHWLHSTTRYMYPNHIQLPVIYRIDYIQPHVICTPITYNYPWSNTLITFNHTLYVPNHIQLPVIYHIYYIKLHVICTPITYNYPWSIALITFNHTLYEPQSHTITRDLSHWLHSTTRYMYPNHIQLPVIYHIGYIEPHVICTQSHTITRDLSHWLHSTTRYMYPITYNYPWSTTLITFNHTLYVPNHIQFPVIYHIDYIQLHVICTQSHTITRDLSHWLHSTTRYMYPITYNFPWSTTLITFNYTLYVPNHIQLPLIYHIDYIQPHVICTQSHTISRDLPHWLHSTTRYMYPITYNYPWSIALITFNHTLYVPQSHTITRDLSHWLHSTTRYMYPNHIQLPVIYHIDYIQPQVIWTPITYNYPWSTTLITFNHTLYVPQSHTITRDLSHWLHSATCYMNPNHIQLPVIYHIDYIQPHVICTPITYNYPWSITLMTFWVTRYMYPITYNYPWSMTLITFNYTLYVPQSHTITRDLSHWWHSELHVICTQSHTITRDLSHWWHSELHVICTQSHTITRDLSHWWHSTTRYMYPNRIQLPVIYHIEDILSYTLYVPNHIQLPVIYHIDDIQPHVICTPITYNYPWSTTLITFNHTLYVPQSHTITRDLSQWWHSELHVICTQSHTITRDLWHWLHSTTRYMYPNRIQLPVIYHIDDIMSYTLYVPKHIQLPVIYRIDYIQPHVVCTQSHTITRDLSHWWHSELHVICTQSHTIPVIYHIDDIQPHVICTPITYNYPWSTTLVTFNYTFYVPQSHRITRDLSHWLHSTTRYMYPNHIQVPVIYHIDYIQPHVICTQSHTITRDLPHWLHSTTRYMYPITYNYPWSTTLITFNHTLYVLQSHTITRDLPHWLHSTTRYMYPNHIELPVICHIDSIQPHVICTPITAFRELTDIALYMQTKWRHIGFSNSNTILIVIIIIMSCMQRRSATAQLDPPSSPWRLCSVSPRNVGSSSQCSQDGMWPRRTYRSCSTGAHRCFAAGVGVSQSHSAGRPPCTPRQCLTTR